MGWEYAVPTVAPGRLDGERVMEAVNWNAPISHADPWGLADPLKSVVGTAGVPEVAVTATPAETHGDTDCIS
jgi:hypothetical protein